MFDPIRLSHDCQNRLLETFGKAISEDGPDIWSPHENPFIRTLIELFTRRGLARIEKVREELSAWTEGRRFAHGPIPPKPGYALIWTPDELNLVRLYLGALPPNAWQLDDYGYLIDYLLQRYMPAQELMTEAEWLTTRANFLGKAQAYFGNDFSVAHADKLMGALPLTVIQAVDTFSPSRAAWAVLEYGRLKACANVVALGADARQALQTTVLDHMKDKLDGDTTATPQRLEQTLFGKFDQMNRDWRRIALTEAGEMANQGVIGAIGPGMQVRRMEMYQGACGFCKKLDGRVFNVKSPDDPDKNGETDVWVGKTNIGRSASPRKKTEDGLQLREPDEMWWPAAGVQHPHCFVNPSVPVYTVEGWKPIGKIKIGDQVLTHLGRFRRVNWVLEGKRYTGKALVFKVGEKNTVKLPMVTPEHPFLNARGWVMANDLICGDHLTALAKKCPTCGDVFTNLKHGKVQYCSNKCIPNTGINQFSDPLTRTQAIEVTRQANIKRMHGLTIEQRRELTAKGRETMQQKGYAHLQGMASKAFKGRPSKNYSSSATEQQIATLLNDLGVMVALQHRVGQLKTDSRGKPIYWWLDLAIPDAKIAIEIDGEPWHGRLSGDRDLIRDADLSAQGWSVLRFELDHAKRNPMAVAEQIARFSMNHNGEYIFGGIPIVGISTVELINAKLYNFGVQDDESYIIGKGIVAHNCRGRWDVVEPPTQGDDPAFEAYLRGVFGIKEGLALGEWSARHK